MSAVPPVEASSRGPAAELSVPAYFSASGHPDCPKDAKGIILVVYDGVPQYNPVTISQQALFWYNGWLSASQRASVHKGVTDHALLEQVAEYRTSFLQYADWLVTNQGSDGIWLYKFAYEGQPVPWWSAMAEGQAVSVLIRAYAITRKPGYLAAATLALATFTRPISLRGVEGSLGGDNWYEEYLSPAHPHVLNGMIYAMMGPYEYWRLTGKSQALDIWNVGVKALADNLHRFDSGSWSYYDAAGYRASLSYHHCHITLLQVVYRMTGLTVFDTYAKRFLSYL